MLKISLLTAVCILCLLTDFCIYCERGQKGMYSNEWLLQADLTTDGARSLAKTYGMEYSHQVLPGYHVLKMPEMSDNSPSPYVLLDRQSRIAAEPKVKSLVQQQYLNHVAKGRQTAREINITDSQWNDMWYLQPDQVPSMGVFEAWAMGYTGAGVRIAVLDDGLDIGHPDLMENHLSDFSYDYLYGNHYPIHNDGNFHGTWCAGIISAVKNDECVVGVAYNSKFSSVKIFDSFYGLTSSGEAEALMHELSQFDIYSNSWGPSDNGQIYSAPGDVVQAALIRGVTEGRNGKGAIYTWAAGNGGLDDNCNCDGYASSIYTISITSISYDLEGAWYSERCTSVLAGTYGGDVPHPAISTTHRNGSCLSSFYGTSATCPMAAGIIALTLEANPELTWRDVQHLIVETASHENLNISASTNGPGKEVNDWFGFGLMNARAMVNRSLSWRTVPDQIVCRSNNITVNGLSVDGSNITSSYTSNGCDGTVRYLEHVLVRVAFQTVRRGTLQIYLKSPSGFISQLLTTRPYDIWERLPIDWTFMTVHHWGENPTGQWQLHVETTDPEIIFAISDWQLILYGTTTDPKFGRVTAEELKGDESDVAAIVGGSVGGGVLIAIAIAVVAAFIYCRPPKKVMDSPDHSKTDIVHTKNANNAFKSNLNNAHTSYEGTVNKAYVDETLYSNVPEHVDNTTHNNVGNANQNNVDNLSDKDLGNDIQRQREDVETA